MVNRYVDRFISSWLRTSSSMSPLILQLGGLLCTALFWLSLSVLLYLELCLFVISRVKPPNK